jgi:putative membrane protein
MTLVINILVSALSVFIAAYVLPGVDVTSFTAALVVAVVLGVMNAFVKPVLTILTLPISIITLGLFSIILNGLLILLVDAIVPGFQVDGFLWALIFGFVLGIINSFFGVFTK